MFDSLSSVKLTAFVHLNVGWIYFGLASLGCVFRQLERIFNLICSCGRRSRDCEYVLSIWANVSLHVLVQRVNGHDGYDEIVIASSWKLRFQSSFEHFLRSNFEKMLHSRVDSLYVEENPSNRKILGILWTSSIFMSHSPWLLIYLHFMFKSKNGN